MSHGLAASSALSTARLRELAPQVLGIVMRRFAGGDLEAAEDAVQEALLAASVQWAGAAWPQHPRAWLVRVAARRLVDQRRSEHARRRREREVAEIGDTELEAEAAVTPARDDTLLLLLMCCHPSLTTGSAIALTLRAVGGLTTGEIAHAFLVPEATMAQRISRAKKTIRASDVPFAMPERDVWPARIGAVLHVLYLVFNEGYTRSTGDDLTRHDLTREAIRLTRKLREALPDDAEVTALLALMRLTDARRLARATPTGDLIPLDEQDRTRWDREAIAEGVKLVEAAMSRGPVGPYQVQAAIAALHDEAPTVEATDWPQILALYDVLVRMADNPMVALSRAIALAMVEGPAAGLAALDVLDVDPRVAGHHRLAAARGHLLELAGDRRGAVEQYRLAAARTASAPEQRYLWLRAARIADAP